MLIIVGFVGRALVGRVVYWNCCLYTALPSLKVCLGCLEGIRRRSRLWSTPLISHQGTGCGDEEWIQEGSIGQVS